MQQHTQNEEWRPVPGHPDYEVSDKGRVRSITRIKDHPVNGWKTYRGRLIKPQRNGTSGHLKVLLGRGNRKYVHRLVLEAFVGPCPPGMEACHWDDDPTNNALENLRWSDRRENMIDRSRNGGCPNRNLTHCKYGHEFNETNTLVTKNGYRKCRTCAKRRMAEFKQRRAAAK